jgi:CRISPR/Cas system CSM-associated protein Csm3 (group 7 of RAMP superfamily)
VRTWRDGEPVVYLPGPSLKGVIRSHCERIVRTVGEGRSCNPVVKEESCVGKQELKQEQDGVHVHKKSCFICQMFGNTVLAGRVRTKDAYPVGDVRTEERNGVAIDRVFGSVAVGPFQMEVVTSGAFETTLTIRNFTIAQLGLLALALRDLKLGRVGVGFGKSRGLGHVTLEWGTLTLRYARPPEDRYRRIVDGVARLLGDKAAEEYGYVARSGAAFGYDSVDQDVSDALYGVALDENEWGEWEMTATGKQIEDVWRTCIPAWKAAIRLEGGV